MSPLTTCRPDPKTAAKPKAEPKRTLKPKKRSKDTKASAIFKEVVCADDCLVEGNGPCEPPLQAAHVVPAAELRKLGLEHLVYDPTNGVSLCYRHHRRHDNWIEKIPRHALPARCFAWAEAHGLTDALERHWPVGVTYQEAT